MLETSEGLVSLQQAGESILEQVYMTAELLDTLHQSSDYQEAVTEQRHKLKDVSLTPSAQVLSALKSSGLSHTEWLLQKSAEHRKVFTRSPLPEDIQQELEQQVSQSLQTQKQIEASDTLNFDQYLEHYLTV